MTPGSSHIKVLDFKAEYLPNPPQWRVTRTVPKNEQSRMWRGSHVPKIVTVGYFLTLDRALLRIRDILVGESGIETLDELRGSVDEISGILVHSLTDSGYTRQP